MKKMRMVYLVLCAAVLVFSWTGTSFANGGGGTLIGDKLLEDLWFGFDGYPLGGVYPNINLTSLDDGGNDPGPGLQYNFDPYLAPGDIELDVFIGFKLSTLSNQLIKDNSLYLDDYSNFNISIKEMITDTAIDNSTPTTVKAAFDGIDYLGFKEVYSLDTGGVQDYDFANFSPTDLIYVTTWIHLEVTDGVNPQLTQFTQRFSQTPEPATMFLLGTGLVGVAGAARRKKKNQA